MPASRSHFAVCYNLDGAERYFIWYSGETDGVLLALPGRVATFSNLDSLDRYLLESNLNRDLSEATRYDFGRLTQWLDKPYAATVDCTFLLDCWNMFTDVTRSTGLKTASHSGAKNVYDKLFWGCNLLTPPGEHFSPEWSDSEIATIAGVLSDGLQAFRAAAGYAA